MTVTPTGCSPSTTLIASDDRDLQLAVRGLTPDAECITSGVVRKRRVAGANWRAASAAWACWACI